MMPYFSAAGSSYELGQGFAPDAGKRKINNVRIAKQVVKKRLDRVQGVWASKLEQDYAYTPRLRNHFPHRTRERLAMLLNNRAARQSD